MLPHHIKPLHRSEIAHASFLSDNVAILDLASFLGFPTVDGVVWLDEQWNTPIARTVNIASDPNQPFKHQAIKTEDTVLVTGLSLGGSSGSPVFLHSKGIKVEPPLTASYTPSMLIGLMSGHKNDGLLHSGLSYLTRSTAILELLDQVDTGNPQADVIGTK